MARGGTCQTLIAYPSSPTPVHLLQLAAQRNVAQLSLVGHRTLRTAPAAFSNDDDRPHIGTRGRHVLSLKGGGEGVEGGAQLPSHRDPWPLCTQPEGGGGRGSQGGPRREGGGWEGEGAEIKRGVAVGAEAMRGVGQQQGLFSPSWSMKPASASWKPSLLPPLPPLPPSLSHLLCQQQQ